MREAGVLELVLAAPERGNAIDLEWPRVFQRGLERLQPSDGAVLLRADGQNFCVGGDVTTFVGDEPGERLRGLAIRFHDTLRRLDAVEVPVVAAVQGWAAGAGFSLALAADLLVISERTRFKTAYQALGLSPDGGMSWHLPRRVGRSVANELLLSDRVLAAREAETLGLASRVVADDALEETARSLAREIAAGSRSAAVAIKRLVRSGAETSLTDHLDLESTAIGQAADHPDGREGIAAFIERRAPRFGGSP